MEDDTDDFTNIFCDSFFSGEQDHWLFDQPLSDSLDIGPAGIPPCPADKSHNYGDLQSICSDFAPSAVKVELSSPLQSVSMKAGPNFTVTDKMKGGPTTDIKPDITSCGNCQSTSSASGRLNLMEGLTEFIPWTGFDYSSDCDFDEEDVEDAAPTGGTSKKKRKRANQKQPSADADLIATATEENLRKLGIDPNSNEGKKQRRKIRNRLSAQLHRERKKGYISYLEGLVKERDLKLSSVSTDMWRLTRENQKLRSKLGIGRSKSIDITDYSSAAGHTDSDTGEDSDTISISSQTPPNSPKKTLTIGSRFKGSKMGSAFSLFTAVLMISITIFGPHIQNINPINTISGAGSPQSTLANTRDNDPAGSALLSIGEGERKERDAVSSSKNSVMKVSSSGKQLIPAHGRSLLSSSASDASSTQLSHSRDALSSPSPSTDYTDSPLAQQAEHMTKSLISSRRSLSAHSKALTKGNQALWQFNDHVTDLYPTYVRYFSPDTESSSNYSTHSTPHSRTVRIRKNLRTREDSNVTHPEHSEKVVYSQVFKYESEPAEEESVRQGGVVDMGKTLVSVLPSSVKNRQSPAVSSSHRTAQPSIDYSTDASQIKYTSVSRVLVTQGRALLDPSLVISPQGQGQGGKANVIPTPKEDTVTDSLIKTLSTWTGRANPPVVRVGAMGSSPIDPSASNNMLVMLLPASAVRWGKSWGESSEGTMEAMLKGLNFTDSAFSSQGTVGGEAGEADDAMWVEIGCSVFRAQLVRNVTLSS